MPRAFLLLCFIAVIGPHHSRAAEWSPFGLEGRIVNTLAQNEMFLYAGTDQGVYRRNLASEDDWVLSGLAGDIVSDIFIDPIAPNTLYAGIGLERQTIPPGDDVTLYKSTDGGSTWFPSDNGMHGLSSHDVVGRPDNPSVLYAAGVAHLSRSLDAGSTWTSLFQPLANSESLAMAQSNPDVMYQAGSSGFLERSLWKSVDAGENWTDLSPPGLAGVYSVVAVDPFDSDVVYIDGALKSIDGGENFSFFPSGVIAGSLIIDPVDSDRLYAGGRISSGPAAQARVSESRDAGETWTDLEGPDGASEVLALLLDRNDPNILYAGTKGSGVFMADVSEQITAIENRVWSAFGDP